MVTIADCSVQPDRQADRQTNNVKIFDLITLSNNSKFEKQNIQKVHVKHYKE